MTTIHLILNGAQIVALKCYGCMPRVWNNQMANIIVEQYNNASFHDGVIDIVP
jgi:predicted nucleotide-binding protein (sugar kinase/HSP70/actin superfamily)